MVMRYDCLKVLAREIGEALVLHPGGGNANEWNSLRPGSANLGDCPVGGVTAMALGLAMALPQSTVVGLETDGGLLMNLSVLPDLGNLQPRNLTIIVFDNEIYESTGTQPSATAGKTDFETMARGAGLENATTARSLKEFEKALRKALKESACHFIVAKVEPGAKDVPHREISGVEMKFKFVRHIEETTGVRVLTPAEQHIPHHLLKR